MDVRWCVHHRRRRTLRRLSRAPTRASDLRAGPSPLRVGGALATELTRLACRLLQEPVQTAGCSVFRGREDIANSNGANDHSCSRSRSVRQGGKMLYTVFVAICLAGMNPAECDRHTAVEWVA